MNQFIKLVIFCWLMFCALFVWVGMAMVGFFFAFTNWSVLYSITPFIGFSAAICIIKCAMYVLLKSNPVAYLDSKITWVENMFGKAKIQR